MELTINDFETVCDNIAKKRAECDAQKDILKQHNEQLEALELKAIEMLELCERDNFPGKAGTIYTSQRTSVTMPKDPEERDKFFRYLREKGAYDSLITINSQSLNSYYKTEREQAIEAGNLDWNIPGLGEAKIFTTIGFRKSK